MFCQMYPKTRILLTAIVALGAIACTASAAPAQAGPSTGKTKIFTVFLGPGYDGARLYYGRSVLGRDGPRRPKSFLSNEDLLAKLHAACKDVEFIRRDLVTYDKLLREIAAMKDELDGVLIVGTTTQPLARFGPTGTEQQPLAFTGLPTIAVQNLFELQGSPFELFAQKGRVLNAYLDREDMLLAPNASKAMFDDLLGKIKLIEVLRKMKEAKILFITGPSTNFSKSDYKVFPPRYNEMYRARLKEAFGTEIVTSDIHQFIDHYKKMGHEEAKKIARMWIDQSKGMRDVTEEEVVESAKLYLTMEKYRKECDASAVFVDWLGNYGVYTHLSMGEMEFSKRGIISHYQPQLDCNLCQMVGYYMTGRMSYVHDIAADPFNNVTLHMHCGVPIRNVWGDKDLPYMIRDYTTSRWDEKLKRRVWYGAVPAVEFPVDVPVTIWKIQVLQKRILVWTGTSISGRSLYKEFEDILCRNKLVLKVNDAERIQSRWNVHEYGCHRTATFGDLRKQIKQFATLIGFEVVEEDR